MTLISMPEADLTIRVTAICCLNDNVKNFYRETHGEIISENDKGFLKQNIIQAITSNMGFDQIR
jgi:hypothetical protein